MRYMGGKSRTAGIIAGYLNMIREPGQPYWEPFVGAGWILERIRGTGANFASDANPYLVAMWQALQAGWKPPQVVTEETYRAIKGAPGDYPPELVAFVGFGCSFGGKWFAGYARGDGRNWASEGKKSVLQKASQIKPLGVCFYVADFLKVAPPAGRCLVYCDPPYLDTTDYGAVPEWNASAFWEQVEALGGYGHTVVVSEYQAPAGFSEVVAQRTHTELRETSGRSPRVERLFRHGKHETLQPALF